MKLSAHLTQESKKRLVLLQIDKSNVFVPLIILRNLSREYLKTVKNEVNQYVNNSFLF